MNFNNKLKKKKRIGTILLASLILFTFSNEEVSAKKLEDKAIKSIKFEAKEEKDINKFFQKYKTEEKGFMKKNKIDKLKDPKDIENYIENNNISSVIVENEEEDVALVKTLDTEVATQKLKEVQLVDGTIREEFVSYEKIELESDDIEALSKEEGFATLSSSTSSDILTAQKSQTAVTGYVKVYYHKDKKSGLADSIHMTKIDCWWTKHKYFSDATSSRKLYVYAKGKSHWGTTKYQNEYMYAYPSANTYYQFNVPGHWLPIWEGTVGAESTINYTYIGLKMTLKVNNQIKGN